MSGAANKGPARPYSPWSEFDPPADLPDDLKAVYRRAAGPILIASSFCSNPDRFTLSPEQLSSWFDPFERMRNELSGWLADHEAELRAKAPETLLALQEILGVVQPLLMRLWGLIVVLDARAADPSDAKLVALVNALRENSTSNHVKLAHASLDGISVSPDSLTELRSALSVWANRREPPADSITPHAEVDAAEKVKGQPARMSWEETAKRLDRLRTQGEPFTSQQKLAEQLGCSSATINKAIKQTPSLQAWAAQPTATPRAQSIGVVVTDNAAQQREPDPEDDAANAELRKVFEEADPEERAFLNAINGAPRDYQSWYIQQSEKARKKHMKAFMELIEPDPTVRVWFLEQPLEQKLSYLNDPDRHQKMLGRKP